MHLTKLQKISVITVTYNAEKTLLQCMRSVFSQTLKNVEFIIIDGASTDHTCHLISTHSQHIAYWVSEPDLGIYDAMNKGIDHATGEWLFFLGADDQLYSHDTLEILFQTTPESCQVIIGDIMYHHHRRRHNQFNKLLYLKNTMHHQGTIYHHSIFKHFRYNSSYKISADYELNLQLFISGAACHCLPIVISICGEQGVSHQVNPVGYHEEINIRNKILGGHSIILPLLAAMTYLRLCIKVITSLFYSTTKERS